MPARRDTLRTAALLLTAAFAVHQLRYALSYGAHTGAALAHQGHAYLLAAAPFLGTLVAVAAARLLGRLAGPPPGRGAREHRLRVLWPACSLALVALYAVQESLEGLFAAGHPGGWAALAAHGGWLALPLALLAGLVLAALLRVSARLEAAPPLRLAALRAGLPLGPPSPALPGAPDAALRPALAGNVGGRGPPLACR
jgi:hypothetical protein